MPKLRATLSRWRPPTNPPSRTSQPPDDLARAAGFRRVAGVDEAGRGPWAGPLVASAVVLRSRHLAVRIDDSKRLTRRQRLEAFHVIVRSADVGIGIQSAGEIDRHNVLQATRLAMQQAIGQLSRPPDLVLVDGAQVPAVAMPCWPIIHGDQRSEVVACASIIAKVARDELMEFYHALYPGYRFDRHKGYGTAAHAHALRTLGPTLLHRFSFRPVGRRDVTEPWDRRAPADPPASLRPHAALAADVAPAA